jgi:hypothetical protein
MSMSLALTLNFLIEESSIDENFGNQRHLLFEKNKVDLVVKNLNSELNLLCYKNILKTSIIISQQPSLLLLTNSLLKCYLKIKIG